MEVGSGPVTRVGVRQSGFDPLGPVVRSAQTASGRTVHFIDEGPDTGLPLVFLGGAGTTVRAFRLMEFARSFREELGIRVISVERNGLGQTSFDPSVGLNEYARDVWSLLDLLGVGNASIAAISGGGPYAAHLAAACPERVRSLHLACAYAESIGAEGITFDLEPVAADPVSWWTFPEGSAVHRIPGFADSAIEEATRAVFAQGRDAPPDGLRQAFGFYAQSPLPDLGRLDAPVFTYWGSDDALVPVEHIVRWRRALHADGPGHGVVERLYDGEGHDVQYRHWDQIMTDVVHLGSKVLLSMEGGTYLVDAAEAQPLLDSGATHGLAAWQSRPPV
ncbi:alpha/beta hydrolase [Pseudarthrobacter sp. J64]|uniref:alpha/beta fold hydrolase n=1 Tax=Pseudarthrobacter sp. J64 TaxID=3116485 RepID=UPI002E802A4A|nr:alpha/beta hydrolase [Pseudarthrobacter sp. J64]MEE2570010.1 alpha/beta hydrolase [Pseudarthrobacter sp. J64]